MSRFYAFDLYELEIMRDGLIANCFNGTSDENGCTADMIEDIIDTIAVKEKEDPEISDNIHA